MQSHWRIFTDTKTREKSLTVIAKLQTKLGRDTEVVNVEPYHKGGHLVTLTLTLTTSSWNDVVVDLLTCAQAFGGGWHLGAFVQEEVDLTSTHVAVPGITMIHCYCVRPETPHAT